MIGEIVKDLLAKKAAFLRARRYEDVPYIKLFKSMCIIRLGG